MHTAECGQVAARTHVVVSYHGPGGIDYAEFDTCCWWNDPPEMTALIDEAEIVEISITDGYEHKHFTDYGYYRTVNPEPGYCVAPGEPWSWTRIQGLPVIADEIDPDERGLFEVRPRPTDSG